MTLISSIWLKSLLVLSLGSILTGPTWAQDEATKADQSDIEKRIDAPARVLDEIMNVPDKAIPDQVMKNAKCIAVIPSMVKIEGGIGGNQITQDKDETRVLYGRFEPFQDILNGKVELTPSRQPFLAAVRRYSEEVQERTSQNESNTGLSASK